MRRMILLSMIIGGVGIAQAMDGGKSQSSKNHDTIEQLANEMQNLGFNKPSQGDGKSQSSSLIDYGLINLKNKKIGEDLRKFSKIYYEVHDEKTSITSEYPIIGGDCILAHQHINDKIKELAEWTQKSDINSSSDLYRIAHRIEYIENKLESIAFDFHQGAFSLDPYDPFMLPIHNSDSYDEEKQHNEQRDRCVKELSQAMTDTYHLIALFRGEREKVKNKTKKIEKRNSEASNKNTNGPVKTISKPKKHDDDSFVKKMSKLKISKN
jgi:hypothetical protein